MPGLLCALVAPVAFTGTAAAGTGNQGALRRLLVSDMTKPSERLPAGVPTYFNWATHPVVTPISTPSRDRAFTAWGELYRCAGAPTVGRAAVQIRRLQAWVLDRGARQWRLIQSSSALHGDAFPADFSGPARPARYVATPTLTTDKPVTGHNFHFWPGPGRVALGVDDVAAVTVALQARLAPSDPQGRTAPCMVASAGADAWTSVDGNTGNDGVGTGRFKVVGRGWQQFTMTTASPSTLQQVGAPALAPVS